MIKFKIRQIGMSETELVNCCPIKVNFYAFFHLRCEPRIGKYSHNKQLLSMTVLHVSNHFNVPQLCSLTGK